MLETEDLALWDNLQRLLGRLDEAVDQGGFLDDCLDLLVELLGADRGLVLVFHDDGGTQVINARGKSRALDPYERDEISRTIVQRVKQTGRCEIYCPLDEQLATESTAALGIGAAMAAPLRAVAWRGGARGSEGVRAVLYLDFRDRRRVISGGHRRFFEAAASVMAAVFEPVHRLQIAREDLRTLAVRQVDAGPSLDELLRLDATAPMRREIASCLKGESTILILGESGTGKTQLARALAEASGRKPIVRAALGASDDLNTITSELFGHEKGAYSGALTKRTGLVEFADGGTLIFDEILNLPPQAQQLLLDFTQFGTFRPLGHERAEPKRARVRLIAATNGDLDGAMAAGRFRSDLYYRLAGVTLVMPPLRERRQDIPSLAEGILRRIDPSRDLRLGVPLRRLLMSPELRWPGNIRQLEAVMARARERALLANADATVLAPGHLEPRDLGVTSLAVPAPGVVRDLTAPLSAGFQLEMAELGDSWARLQREREALDAIEKTIIGAALEKHGGVAAHAARELGVGRTSLVSRMDTLGVGKVGKRR